MSIYSNEYLRLILERLAEMSSGALLPDQTGQAGKFLKTDGTSPLWDVASGGSSASRATFSKAAYNVAVTDTYVAQVGVYTPGTDAGGSTAVNLPAAASYGAGKMLVIGDESGSIRPWYRLAVTPNGAELIDAFNLPVILNTPYQSVALLCTGTGWKKLPTITGNMDGMKLDGSLARGQVHMFHDLDLIAASSTSSNPIRVAVSGGSIISLASNGSRNGVWGAIQITAGTAAGHYGLASMGDPAFAKRNDAITKHYVEVHASLNGAATAIDGTDDYIPRVGMSDARAGTAPADGAWFAIDRTQSTTKLCIVSAKSGTGTTLVVSAIDIPATNTGHRYGVEVNDALTECYFFYDDTYVDTINTNTPYEYAIDCPFAQAVWVAGANKGFWVDYFRQHYISQTSYLRATE